MWLAYSHDGAEYLFSHRDRPGVFRLDNSWLDKVSSRIVSVTTTQNFPALLLRLGNIASGLLECRLAAVNNKLTALKKATKGNGLHYWSHEVFPPL